MAKSKGPRLYDTARWRAMRKLYFQRHPLCVECQSIGRVVAASHLDHVRPIEAAPELAWSWDNLQGLCASCHSSKTASSDRGFGRAPAPRKIKGCDVNGWPTDPNHAWNRRTGR
jgi:5-methylcytosine-specific restriction endonuclease McrA